MLEEYVPFDLYHAPCTRGNAFDHTRPLTQNLRPLWPLAFSAFDSGKLKFERWNTVWTPVITTFIGTFL